MANTVYDNAGNLTKTTLNEVLVYDANNRQTSYTSGGATTYHYDAQGNRVKKSGPSGTSVYVYDAFGKLAAEYSNVSPQPAHVGTFYRTVDHLGSTRLVTDGLGAAVENTDYLPFGEEILVSSGDARHVAAYGESGRLRHKFTGKERDTESGMDYFLARYYSGPMGRFLSVDPGNAGAWPDDPRTWNLYAYVSNNPMIFVDPDGREIKYAADLKNEQLVKDSVTAILDNGNTNTYLSGFVGPDAPDLTIRSDDLGAPTVKELGDGRTLTTTVKGNMDPHIQTTTFNDGPSQTLFTGATITISTRASKGETPGIMIHEAFHAREAQQDPVQFSQNRKNEAGLEHDKRPQEERANGARDANVKQIKDRIKQIKKDRKKEEE